MRFLWLGIALWFLALLAPYGVDRLMEKAPPLALNILYFGLSLLSVAFVIFSDPLYGRLTAAGTYRISSTFLIAAAASVVVGSAYWFLVLPLLPSPKAFYVSATTSAANYPAGTTISGIPWDNRYTPVELTFRANAEITDLELYLNPDQPVVAIAQATKLAGVAWSTSGDKLRPGVEIIDAQGVRTGVPVVLIATTSGYTVTIPTMKRGEELVIVIATATPDPPKVEATTNPLTVWMFPSDREGEKWWYARHPFPEAFAPNRPRVLGLFVNAKYKVGRREQNFTEAVITRDRVGELINSRGLTPQ